MINSKDDAGSGKQLLSKPHANKFYGIQNKNAAISSDQDMGYSKVEKKKKRVAGLNREYPVKKLSHPPEEFTFSPKIKHFNPEPDKKKRHRTQRLMRETTSHDKGEHIRSLISNHKATKEKV